MKLRLAKWKEVFPGVWKYDTGKPPATLTGLAGLVIVLMIVLGMVSDLFGNIKTLFELY